MEKRIWDLSEFTQKAILVTALIEQYYYFESTGGKLHIVLDDGNIEDHHIQYCLNMIENDIIGKTIAEILLTFTIEQREQVLEKYYEILEQVEKILNLS